MHDKMVVFAWKHELAGKEKNSFLILILIMQGKKLKKNIEIISFSEEKEWIVDALFEKLIWKFVIVF